MPIFEYTCKGCGHEFETLVRGTETATCPECKSEELEKHFSLPAIKSDSTRALAMRAARKRDQRQGRANTEEQRLYEENHAKEEMGM
jgi:putative FmdB family regulatory protein